MSHYTPLDLSLLLKEGGGGMLFKPKKRDGFDQVFFPFAIIVLVMSLSFYAIKQATHVFSANHKAQVAQPTESPRAIVTQFITQAPISPVSKQVYQDLNGILVDSDRIVSTAEAQYPNVSKAQLIDLVNKSLVEWAALRQYYEDDPKITKELSLTTDAPIATFGAVLRDVGTMVKEYDKSSSSYSKPTIAALVEAYTINSNIR